MQRSECAASSWSKQSKNKSSGDRMPYRHSLSLPNLRNRNLACGARLSDARTGTSGTTVSETGQGRGSSSAADGRTPTSRKLKPRQYALSQANAEARTNRGTLRATPSRETRLLSNQCRLVPPMQWRKAWRGCGLPSLRRGQISFFFSYRTKVANLS